MTALLITLADFADYVPFSVNIDALLVNPHIRDAQTFDVWPVLPEALRLALAGDRAQWSAELSALFAASIRPLLVCESARRMLLWHGAHVTPASLETISDIGHAPVTSAQRTELRSDLQAKCAHYHGLLQAALRRAYPAATSSTCAAPRFRLGNGGTQLSAI